MQLGIQKSLAPIYIATVQCQICAARKDPIQCNQNQHNWRWFTHAASRFLYGPRFLSLCASGHRFNCKYAAGKPIARSKPTMLTLFLSEPPRHFYPALPDDAPRWAGVSFVSGSFATATMGGESNPK